MLFQQTICLKLFRAVVAHIFDMLYLADIKIFFSMTPIKMQFEICICQKHTITFIALNWFRVEFFVGTFVGTFFGTFFGPFFGTFYGTFLGTFLGTLFGTFYGILGGIYSLDRHTILIFEPW